MALGAGAKMGGGSPAPSVTSFGIREWGGGEEEGGAALVDGMPAIAGVRKVCAMLLVVRMVLACCLKEVRGQPGSGDVTESVLTGERLTVVEIVSIFFYSKKLRWTISCFRAVGVVGIINISPRQPSVVFPS